MPISFGTSTMAISLPALSGALAAWPPSYGSAAAGPVPPLAAQASGLVARSSAPSHLLAAFAAPAANDKTNNDAAVVVNKLVFITHFLPRCRSCGVGLTNAALNRGDAEANSRSTPRE